MITTLKGHGFELGLDPASGGTVAFLRRGGEDILRPTRAGSSAPLESAAFPLVPFSGRIVNGRFQFRGRDIALPSNMPPEPHAIHGHGWHRSWGMVEVTTTRARMQMEFSAAEWPWSYVAEQVFTVDSTGVRVMLTVTNTSDTPMPAGLGWHPYFPRGDAKIICDVAGYWPADGSPLSKPMDDFDLRAGKIVDAITIDTAFLGTGRPAQLSWPSRKLAVEVSASENMTHWIIYVPNGEAFFCVEPVSHAPNALNMPSPPNGAEMEILQPGETMTAHCALKISDV